MKNFSFALVAFIQIYSAFLWAQKLELVSSEHGIPWGMVFVDENTILFTERQGSFKVLDLKTKAVQTLETTIDAKQGGQAGLLDVALDTGFAKTHKIYFVYAKTVNQKHTTTLARAELRRDPKKGWALLKVQDLFRAIPYGHEGLHYGSRLLVTDQEIWMTVGDRGQRDLAQELSSHMGKLLRLNKDEKAMPDNPFVDRAGALPEIWSYGHRNSQGLIKHPETGDIWLHEHGPRGGDEINLIKKGANYGWPLVSYGREYWGKKISKSPKKEGIVDPVYQYTPSIAPSGFVFYSGNKIPAFKNSFLLGALALTHLNQVIFQPGKDPIEKRYFENQGLRIREVEVGPDELIYFSTDAGEIWRVVP